MPANCLKNHQLGTWHGMQTNLIHMYSLLIFWQELSVKFSAQPFVVAVSMCIYLYESARVRGKVCQ